MMTIDRQRGTLIGLAVGDALGAAVEFKAPGTFPPVTDYRAGGPHGLGPGEWTDDTSMALAMADSIACNGWNLADQLERYVQWREHGKYSVNDRCFDVGIATSRALWTYRQTRDPRNSGSPDENSSGNGSIMRLAPVPIRYGHLFPHQLEELLRIADESSLTTHASPQCRSACQYMTLLICGLLHGYPREMVLSPTWEPLQELRRLAPLHPLVEEISQGSFFRKQPPEIRGSGWVIHTLEASLWAFHDAECFRDAVLKVVNLGEDADTTGAVCGQFAGACFGEIGIPLDWRKNLVRREMIETALQGLTSGEPIGT